MLKRTIQHDPENDRAEQIGTEINQDRSHRGSDKVDLVKHRAVPIRERDRVQLRPTRCCTLSLGRMHLHLGMYHTLVYILSRELEAPATFLSHVNLV